MKRTFVPVLLCLSAAFASDPKFGVLVEGLFPVVDAPSPFESSVGFGGMGAVEARFDLDERISIAPFAGFEYILHGVEAEEDEEKVELTLKSMFLPLGASFQMALTPALRLAFTPELDISLGGKGKSTYTGYGESYESDEEDIEGEDSPFLIGIGIAYGETDKSALLLGYKFAVSEYAEEYKLHKFYLGGRFAM
jgi:hypothetical protein